MNTKFLAAAFVAVAALIVAAPDSWGRQIEREWGMTCTNSTSTTWGLVAKCELLGVGWKTRVTWTLSPPSPGLDAEPEQVVRAADYEVYLPVPEEGTWKITAEFVDSAGTRHTATALCSQKKSNRRLDFVSVGTVAVRVPVRLPAIAPKKEERQASIN